MKYEIYIMNHPERKIQPSLIKSLNKYLMKDYEREVHIWNEISIKEGNKKILVNIVEEFLKTSDRDYLFFFSDDIILGKNFFPAVDYLFEQGLRENIIVFYSARNEVHKKKFGFVRFKGGNTSMYSFATLFSRWFCEKMVKYKDTIIERFDDRYMGAVSKKIKIEYIVTNPSFVQHSLESPSLFGHDRSSSIIRQSKTFNEDIDLLKIVKKWY